MAYYKENKLFELQPYVGHVMTFPHCGGPRNNRQGSLSR